MNVIELQRSLRQLRLGGMAAVLETRLHQAQAEPMAPIDFLACLVSDELTRRVDRLLERRRKEWKPRESEFGSGYIWKYAQQVGPAVNGAVTHPGGAAEKQCYADA